jgi:DNA polymerase-3 subunit alpha
VAKRDPLLPRFPASDGRTEADELAHQAREGLKARMAAGQANVFPVEDYEARLEREIQVITRWGSPATS